MKNTMILKSLLAAALLCGSATILMAQSTTTACPLGHKPGYGRSLTAEQKTAQRAEMQKLVAELRQKQANNTLTSEEQAWLQMVEKRGGQCINGTPRGPGGGKGQGAGNGHGKGKGQGMRDGSGPRGANGTCPLGITPQTDTAK